MKRKKELIVILSSLLVIVLSVSVAYFTTKILGTGKDISVTSADLKVIFTSGSGTINGTNIEPGWSSGENTFTVKNESNGTYKYNIIIKDLVNTFTTSGFLVYKITSPDGGYNMADFVDVPKSSAATDTVLAENISIEKGKTHTYKIIINYNNSDDVDQSADMGKTLTGKLFITKGTERPTLANQLLNDNPTIGTRNDFSTPFTTNTANTLYKATDAYIGTSAFNTNAGSPKYAGYMYGDSDTTLEEARTNTNNSTIKTVIDNWYARNMTSYTKYLSTTAVYCNDRELASGATYSSSDFDFKSNERLDTNKAPSYDCATTEDKFTVDTSTGNGKLTYPIALMTTDELVFAGWSEQNKAPMWYYTNSSFKSSTGVEYWWSLSPGFWSGGFDYSWYVDVSNDDGFLNMDMVDNAHGVRPVVSLKACTLWSQGDGSSSIPYEIVETSSGC